MSFRKDQSLDALADSGNVAQFVSFTPVDRGGLVQNFCRIADFAPNHKFADAPEALTALLAKSPGASINLRSFTPDSPRSREFIYGVSKVDDAVAAMNRLAQSGLFIIANETVDVADGGVSGVIEDDVMEFAPDDTPRCVEKPGVASLPLSWGMPILRDVYGFEPEIVDTRGSRLEFSIHPKPRGWKKTHTLLWELAPSAGGLPASTFAWPNRFSRHIGDKAYGLLVANRIGVPVPRTTVIARRVAPFTFGRPTGSFEVWTRTCPFEPEPGRFTTLKGWSDPFKLLAAEDPEGGAIASVLSQDAVVPQFSGAAIVDIDGKLVIEGGPGAGDLLMLGRRQPEPLPSRIVAAVEAIYERLHACLGAVRFEWVHDDQCAWVVQLHKGGTLTGSGVLMPGEASEWTTFKADAGLEALRELLNDLPEGVGLNVRGEIGLTSHLADLIRKSNRPARIIR